MSIQTWTIQRLDELLPESLFSFIQSVRSRRHLVSSLLVLTNKTKYKWKSIQRVLMFWHQRRSVWNAGYICRMHRTIPFCMITRAWETDFFPVVLPVEERKPPGLWYPFFVAGWEWSTMGKGTDVGMRRQWGVLWLRWCRLPFIVTTGPDAAAKNSKDIYSKDLSALGGSCFTKGNRSLCRSWDVGPVCCPPLGEEKRRGNPGVKAQAQVSQTGPLTAEALFVNTAVPGPQRYWGLGSSGVACSRRPKRDPAFGGIPVGCSVLQCNSSETPLSPRLASSAKAVSWSPFFAILFFLSNLC